MKNPDSDPLLTLPSFAFQLFKWTSSAGPGRFDPCTWKITIRNTDRGFTWFRRQALARGVSPFLSGSSSDMLYRSIKKLAMSS